MDDPLVRVPVVVRPEGLFAEAAFELLLAGVRGGVVAEEGGAAEGGAAKSAGEGLLARVEALVVLEAAGRAEPRRTEPAQELLRVADAQFIPVHSSQML